MYNDQTAENVLPGDYAGPPINASTPAQPEDLIEPGDTNKGGFFDHLGRLQDKLIGAVDFDITAAIDRANNPANVAESVSNTEFSYLPAFMQSFAVRYRGWFYAAAFGAVAFMFIQVLRLLRK